MSGYISASICLHTVIWQVEEHSLFGDLEAMLKDYTYIMFQHSKIWINCICPFEDIGVYFI